MSHTPHFSGTWSSSYYRELVKDEGVGGGRKAEKNSNVKRYLNF